MRRQVGWLVGLLISVAPMDAYAQPWSGLLSPSRAVEWTSAGVSGGIPNRATICTTLNPGATATQINNAIAACPSGQVVFLNAGTFNLSSGINMRKNNITLRGAGAAQTILRFSGTTGCFIGEGAAISVCSGEQLDFGSVIHSANWTAGYATGTTVITLSNTTGLVVGNHMMIDQLDDTVDGWPATGDIVVNGTTSFSGEGGNEWVRGGNRGQTQVVTVVAINGLNVTIDPPVALPNYRASQSPGAWWGNVTAKGIGIENLTVDDTGNAGSSNDSIQLHNTLNCWIKGVRVVSNASWGAAQHHNLIRLVYTGRTTIRDGYFYGPLDGNIVRYGWASQVASNTLWENNILHHIPSPIVPNDPEIASV